MHAPVPARPQRPARPLYIPEAERTESPNTFPARQRSEPAAKTPSLAIEHRNDAVVHSLSGKRTKTFNPSVLARNVVEVELAPGTASESATANAFNTTRDTKRSRSRRHEYN